MVSGNVAVHIFLAIGGWLQGTPKDNLPFDFKFQMWQFQAQLRDLAREYEAIVAEFQQDHQQEQRKFQIELRQIYEVQLKAAREELARIQRAIKVLGVLEDPTRPMYTKLLGYEERSLQRRIAGLEAELQKPPPPKREP